MRKIKKPTQFSVAPNPDVVETCEYSSLGQKIRDAIDQGVKPDVNVTSLDYDSQDDGDDVDPIADPRADHFDVVASLESHLEKATAEQNESVENSKQ